MAYAMSLQDRLRALSMMDKNKHVYLSLIEAADQLDVLHAQVIELRNAMIVMEALQREQYA